MNIGYYVIKPSQLNKAYENYFLEKMYFGFYEIFPIFMMASFLKWSKNFSWNDKTRLESLCSFSLSILFHFNLHELDSKVIPYAFFNCRASNSSERVSRGQIGRETMEPDDFGLQGNPVHTRGALHLPGPKPLHHFWGRAKSGQFECLEFFRGDF